jgi:NAD+ kinase
MEKTFNKIAIIGKYKAPETQQNVLTLAAYLDACGKTVLIEKETATHAQIQIYPTIAIHDLSNQVDFAIVVGGDGTMLGVLRQLATQNVPLIGINLGRRGFLTDISLDSMQVELDKIFAGEYTLEHRILLKAEIIRNGQLIGEGVAMNDVVVNKMGMSRLIELEVYIDGQFVHNQRSDGLILATPTGTTAYALSAGGPILYPTLDAITMVPICPHTLSNRPIAFNSSSKVEIGILHAEQAAVHLDGQIKIDIKKDDRVFVAKDTHTVSLIHPQGYSHYAVLRQKLGWG